MSNVTTEFVLKKNVEPHKIRENRSCTHSFRREEQASPIAQLVRALH